MILPPRLLLLAATTALASPAVAQNDFQDCLQNIRAEATRQGVPAPVIDTAFRGLTPDPKVIDLDSKQPEFSLTYGKYVANMISPDRVAKGQQKLAQYRGLLDALQGEYGVPGQYLVAFWGAETNYGSYMGDFSALRSVATLACMTKRTEFFSNETVQALRILADNHMTTQQMKGSWAGAMGQTQFMPSSFLKFAVDFEGHGRRDIWTSAADAIGSTANYLKEHGWRAGQPWGFEVALPKGYALTAADSSAFAPFSAFAERGVKRADGRPLPQSGEAQLLIPAGLNGPIFLVTPNFKVIKSYNNSTSYALAVALLGDRAMGGQDLAAAWPVHDKSLNMTQARDMQTRLKKMGYDVGKIDGKFGETGQTALRAYQEKSGLTPDGYPTLALLQRLRKQP